MLQMLRAAAFAVALCPMMAFATAQVPDYIRIDRVDHALNTNPLEPHLAHKNWKPPEDAAISSANWRGYIASWEVAQGQLVLNDVTIHVSSSEPGDYVAKSILADLFPSTTTPVVADWYSGALIISEGEITHYVHMGYGSSYERYQVLRVASGKVIERLQLSADEFERYKAEKFKAFTTTDEFKESIANMRKDVDTRTDEQLFDFIKSYYAERYLPL
ncbi:hypothetical protein [Luteimonas suaedae]|uniref:hypothetical protein n=1 Tax=Luteimonas suaedae TaxID=2605430 RepID=UPI001CA8BECC|nr:hypothetical protein [Luteimonas suaedae]